MTNFTQEEQDTIRTAIELLTKSFNTNDLGIKVATQVVYDVENFSPYKAIQVNDEEVKLYVNVTKLKS